MADPIKAAPLKEALISLLNALSLEGVPHEKKEELIKAKELLKRNHIRIPQNSQGQIDVCQFIQVVFQNRYPELMNDANKKSLIDCLQQIGISNTEDFFKLLEQAESSVLAQTQSPSSRRK